MRDFVEQHGVKVDFSQISSSWVLLTEMERKLATKIQALGKPLNQWKVEIYRGILTGCNEAFVITSEKRQEILQTCTSPQELKRTEQLIRPILRGRDIKPEGYDWNDLWLINVHNGIKGRINRINIQDYPAIKKHLDQYLPILKKRTDKGDTPYNLRNCAYLEDFNKPKIIYPNMTKYLPFIYDEQGFFTNQKCFILTGEKLEYLVAFFNSSIFKSCCKNYFPELLGGTRELSKIFFEKIPIPKIDDKEFSSFKELVGKIEISLSKTQQEIVNSYFYKKYELTKEEIKFIEEACS